MIYGFYYTLPLQSYFEMYEDSLITKYMRNNVLGTHWCCEASNVKEIELEVVE